MIVDEFKDKFISNPIEKKNSYFIVLKDRQP